MSAISIKPLRQEPPVSLRLPQELLTELDTIARRFGQCSRSAILRRAVSEFVEANRVTQKTEGRRNAS